MSFQIIEGDITALDVDAIVNAANTGLQMGGGVCGAIFSGAGPLALQAACDPLAPIQTGEAVITPGFKLPARFVIHTAGPIYRGGEEGEEGQLRACYGTALRLAMAHQCRSIAFPLISSGIYGYPREDALRVAKEAIAEFLAENDGEDEMEVFLVLYR